MLEQFVSATLKYSRRRDGGGGDMPWWRHVVGRRSRGGVVDAQWRAHRCYHGIATFWSTDTANQGVPCFCIWIAEQEQHPVCPNKQMIATFCFEVWYFGICFILPRPATLCEWMLIFKQYKFYS